MNIIKTLKQFNNKQKLLPTYQNFSTFAQSKNENQPFANKNVQQKQPNQKKQKIFNQNSVNNKDEPPVFTHHIQQPQKQQQEQYTDAQHTEFPNLKLISIQNKDLQSIKFILDEIQDQASLAFYLNEFMEKKNELDQAENLDGKYQEMQHNINDDLVQMLVNKCQQIIDKQNQKFHIEFIACYFKFLDTFNQLDKADTQFFYNVLGQKYHLFQHNQDEILEIFKVVQNALEQENMFGLNDNDELEDKNKINQKQLKDSDVFKNNENINQKVTFKANFIQKKDYKSINDLIFKFIEENFAKLSLPFYHYLFQIIGAYPEKSDLQSKLKSQLEYENVQLQQNIEQIQGDGLVDEDLLQQFLHLKQKKINDSVFQDDNFNIIDIKNEDISEHLKQNQELTEQKKQFEENYSNKFHKKFFDKLTKQSHQDVINANQFLQQNLDFIFGANKKSFGLIEIIIDLYQMEQELATIQQKSQFFTQNYLSEYYDKFLNQKEEISQENYYLFLLKKFNDQIQNLSSPDELSVIVNFMQNFPIKWGLKLRMGKQNQSNDELTEQIQKYQIINSIRVKFFDFLKKQKYDTQINQKQFHQFTSTCLFLLKNNVNLIGGVDQNTREIVSKFIKGFNQNIKNIQQNQVFIDTLQFMAIAFCHKKLEMPKNLILLEKFEKQILQTKKKFNYLQTLELLNYITIIPYQNPDIIRQQRMNEQEKNQESMKEFINKPRVLTFGQSSSKNFNLTRLVNYLIDNLFELKKQNNDGQQDNKKTVNSAYFLKERAIFQKLLLLGYENQNVQNLINDSKENYQKLIQKALNKQKVNHFEKQVYLTLKELNKKQFQNQLEIQQNYIHPINEIEVDFKITLKNENKQNQFEESQNGFYLDIHGDTHYYEEFQQQPKNLSDQKDLQPLVFDNYFTLSKSYILKDILNLNYLVVSKETWNTIFQNTNFLAKLLSENLNQNQNKN